VKIFIITTEDSLYTLPFLKKVILARKNDIVGVALVTKGGRLTVRKKDSKTKYLLTLFIILGPFTFFRDVLKTILYKFEKQVHSFLPFVKSPCILSFSENLGISTYRISSPNNELFLNELKKIVPDIVINQSQNILKEKLLSIPQIGILNRHNALLPKNRGRLTPFWVKYKGDSETGVSIHFVEKKIDSGAIVVQVRFRVNKNDSIRSIVKRNYEIAPVAMLNALQKLEDGENDFLENSDSDATYNSIPNLKDALRFRIGLKYK
jgi:folate-dependent phosphoribosylglycinamide formyltransferase PurN